VATKDEYVLEEITDDSGNSWYEIGRPAGRLPQPDRERWEVVSTYETEQASRAAVKALALPQES
jgi:hypothetical protein